MLHTNMKLYIMEICDSTVFGQWHVHINFWCDKKRYYIQYIKPYTSYTNVEDIKF